MKRLIERHRDAQNWYRQSIFSLLDWFLSVSFIFDRNSQFNEKLEQKMNRSKYWPPKIYLLQFHFLSAPWNLWLYISMSRAWTPLNIGGGKRGRGVNCRRPHQKRGKINDHLSKVFSPLFQLFQPLFCPFPFHGTVHNSFHKSICGQSSPPPSFNSFLSPSRLLRSVCNSIHLLLLFWLTTENVNKKRKKKNIPETGHFVSMSSSMIHSLQTDTHLLQTFHWLASVMMIVIRERK